MSDWLLCEIVAGTLPAKLVHPLVLHVHLHVMGGRRIGWPPG